jgi:hypothetical protein
MAGFCHERFALPIFSWFDAAQSSGSASSIKKPPVDSGPSDLYFQKKSSFIFLWVDQDTGVFSSVTDGVGYQPLPRHNST